MIVNIKLAPGALCPVHKTKEASGADLCSNEFKTLGLGVTAVISTGVYLEIPKGYEIQVRSRSGMAAKGIFVANSPGTIDADYTGEIKVILHNASGDIVKIAHGDRIAQIVLAEVTHMALQLTDVAFRETERGEKGLGSTGLRG